MSRNISVIDKSNNRDREKMSILLAKEGISLDANLDYSIGIFDDEYNLLATGSCFKNTLRCMAVDSDYQGEGLLNQIVTSLIEYQSSIGNYDLFIYTKIDTAKFFNDLGFYEIARVENSLVFMENKNGRFSSYLKNLSAYKKDGVSGAIVMNANPFTNGHKYLIEKALEKCDNLYVFVVSEDMSEIPYELRMKLVIEGTKNYEKVTVIPSGDYIISTATFPSYFLKDADEVTKSHAALDAIIFKDISYALDISYRFVGTEPMSETTNAYNQVLKNVLPLEGVNIVEIERLEIDGEIISASKVRKALKEHDDETLKKFLPETSYTNLVMKVLL